MSVFCILEYEEGAMLSPSPYHLLDHEYGQTPQNQIMQGPPTEPPRSQVGLFPCGVKNIHRLFKKNKNC